MDFFDMAESLRKKLAQPVMVAQLLDLPSGQYRHQATLLEVRRATPIEQKHLVGIFTAPEDLELPKWLQDLSQHEPIDGATLFDAFRKAPPETLIVIDSISPL